MCAGILKEWPPLPKKRRNRNLDNLIKNRKTASKQAENELDKDSVTYTWTHKKGYANSKPKDIEKKREKKTHTHTRTSA